MQGPGHLKRGSGAEKMVLDFGCSRGFDHHSTRKSMEIGTAIVWVGLNRVRQVGPTKVKEKQQTWGEANSSQEGKHRVERADCTVHVSIDVASDNPHRDLSDEETNDDQPSIERTVCQGVEALHTVSLSGAGVSGISHIG